MRDKILWTVNAALVIVVFLLALQLMGTKIPSVGKVRALLDGEEPSCIVKYQQRVAGIDFGSCCRGAVQQLECSRFREVNLGIRTDYKCSTGRGDVVSYLLNAKAYNACREVVGMP